MEKIESFEAHLVGNTLSSNSKKAYTISKESFFGEFKQEKIFYSLSEGFFLMKNKGMKICFNKKILNEGEVLKKFSKMEKDFRLKSHVYEDLRKKGFILKSGIKYGADFSIYLKGKKPGKDHSEWLLSIKNHSTKSSWEEFILKNRVANSTKKKVLLAIQDGEGNIIYYEVNWKKI
ncbi:tRNA-intron lyase [Candidatus Pacearchaeota archaeon CG10_big_fil_rev_8_21_14_0_10_32_42]|nr:MAG: tRNA-intron lyase [Candidatus Pacearchaeota archaeon CG10_big_fil_rev_8_21_14_0_10_32_42]